MSVPLRFGNIDALPLIHGDSAFAVEARERLLGERYRVIAVELPPSLRAPVLEGIDRLPIISAVVYRQPSWATGEFAPQPDADDAHDDELRRSWYVPIDPCDGIIEALRIARGERSELRFIDAEIEQFAGRSLVLPDAHAVTGLGLQAWYDAIRPTLQRTHPASEQDLLRERHMAAELRQISASVGTQGKVLFLGGLAHWERIRTLLERGEGELYRGTPPSADAIDVVPVHHGSLFHVLGEMPLVTWFWQRHRSGFAVDRFRLTECIHGILDTARQILAEHHAKSLDRPGTAALASLVTYARKLTLHGRRLVPDLYTLVLAAKGTVGNDFALAVLEAARTYPPNRLLDGGFVPADRDDPATDRLPPGLDELRDGNDGGDGNEQDPPAWLTGLMDSDEPFAVPRVGPELETTGTIGRIGDEVARMTSRTPGARRELKRIKLRGPPPDVDRRLWQTVWNPFVSCSWPPEDVIIENFRSYLSSRALALAGLERVKVEEFTASMKDGLALRETLRDLPRGRIFVKEEPRVPGRVGAVVMIFEEDDFAERFPWRLTWQAEHDNESTLAFYATDFRHDLVGPGVARAIYGGCMLLFPPQPMPDIWDDLRFERARTPAERLLLAALWYSTDRFVAHLADKPPAPELQDAAARLGKHIIHLPLSTMSRATIEKLRRFHVLNGHRVRSWAARFIR